MNVTWGLLTVLSLACHTESRCSPTSYYKNCWIRRFPGIFINIEESQRRGAQLLKSYQEETALKCSRTCCLTRNFSCNLAIFHYDTTQENVNCFHLHCPTLESCILSHRGNVVLYNITKGADPDLLVFGKYFTSNVRVLPHHYSRGNASELLPPDKRQFLHPPPPAVQPLTPATAPPTTASRAPTITTSTSTPATSTPTQQSTTSLRLFHPSQHTPLIPYNPKTTPAFSTTHAQPSTTFSQMATSPPTSTSLMGSLESSKQSSNDTKSSAVRNHTAGGEEDHGVSGEETFGGLGSGWHVAAHTLLVAVAVFITVLLSCCCSILLVVSWRGQRKRMGRYRTSWRGKSGSMRLIKYVLVRESS
ncbi:hypothetical protein F7725_023152 [Dissostichus mawsoni]|uniref:MANSC domain-containing protein n=1 Tax=Dissostichus mawsoni TaxID=36200 RepID=A0A7J5Z2T5_DISMA|nr:hypothetical protein F7725_023152 [Dissostichus mawsoni]